MPDSASEHCLLCVDKFTYSNRRHHCRGCGILCCDLCSTKRLMFKTVNGSSGSSSPVPPSSSSAQSNKVDGSRTCDGCFNKFSFECNLWQQASLKARREQEKADARRAKEGGSSPAGSDKARGGDAQSGGSYRDHASVKTASSVGNSAAALNSTMSETMRALDERGAKLQDTAERSEEMLEAAGEFNAMTRKLLKQQQQKNNWMGGSTASPGGT